MGQFQATMTDTTTNSGTTDAAGTAVVVADPAVPAVSDPAAPVGFGATPMPQPVNGKKRRGGKKDAAVPVPAATIEDFDDDGDGEPDTDELTYIPRGTPDDIRAKHYIRTRWKPQADYYDSKGGFNKKRHQTFQLGIGVGSVVITLLLAIGVDGRIVAVLSALISVATVMENVYKYGDAWRRFRQGAEGLKREKVMFDMGSGPYRRSKDPVLLFTERCEDVILQESGSFFQREDQQQGQQQDQQQGQGQGQQKAPTAGG